MIHVPTFPMYAARIRVAGGNVIAVPMRSDFYWDVDAMLAAVTPATKLIFVCSPNNPTGNQIAEPDLRRILDRGLPTFFDEAYYELEDQVVSRAPLIQEYPHMMVNRTLSKAFGLAGLRLGYVLCQPQLATYFNRVRIPWNVGLITLAAALAGLEDVEDQKRKRDNVLRGRRYLFDEINKMPGLRAFPSEGNFVLIDASILNVESSEIRDYMAGKGIFIRPMSGHNMPRGFIRITVGTPDQNVLFVRIFGEYVRQLLGI
jgi:histidinol-phosphate aminotransferase